MFFTSQVNILLLCSNKIHTVRDRANISLEREKQNHCTEDPANKFTQQLPSHSLVLVGVHVHYATRKAQPQALSWHAQPSQSIAVLVGKTGARSYIEHSINKHQAQLTMCWHCARC